MELLDSDTYRYTRTCERCGATKDRSQFVRAFGQRNGYVRRCKECRGSSNQYKMSGTTTDAKQNAKLLGNWSR